MARGDKEQKGSQGTSTKERDRKREAEKGYGQGGNGYGPYDGRNGHGYGPEGRGQLDEPSFAPRTVEQLVSGATATHEVGYGQRPARGHGYEIRGLNYLPLSRLHEGRFGRMFRLQPFIPSDQRIGQIAQLLTEPGGGPSPQLDNPDIPAGYTYFGQFVDHDITFDPVSSLTRQTDPDSLTNFRSPRYDLDSVYGRGPADDPFLYDLDDGRDKFLIGRNLAGQDDDLPRNSQETALIGDPRNDENIFVGQFQLTMLKFHNRVVDEVTANQSLRMGSETTFEAAQRIVRWHYQWVVVHDYLRRSVGQQMLGEVLDETGPLPKVNRQFYAWKHDPYMPVEFSVGAFRFGHSQIRGRYTLNSTVPPLPVFTSDPLRDNPLGHFGGFRDLPGQWTVEWGRFFELNGAAGGNQRQQTRLIDTNLAGPLMTLPPEIGGDVPSLAIRNLTRGARLLLPSGQAVAQHMGVTPLADIDLGLPGGGPAPLWYYVLKEAEVQAGGRRLGDVGGRIVAEVLVGLLEKDASSYLRNQPAWKPFLPAMNAADFSLADLIAFADHGLGQT